MSEKDPWKKVQTNVKKNRLNGVGFSPKSFAKFFFLPNFYRAYHDGKARQGDDGTRGQGPLPVASPEKRFFVVVRWEEMFSYSANRIRTTKSKTQSWITKKMSRIANVIFIVLQMYNHDCHILLIASCGALRYVQRQLSWTLITCVNMVRFKKS